MVEKSEPRKIEWNQILVALELNRNCVKHDLEKMRSEKKDIYFKQLEHTKIIEIGSLACKILSWGVG